METMLITANFCNKIGLHNKLKMLAYSSVHSYQFHDSKEKKTTSNILHVENSHSIQLNIFQTKGMLIFFVYTSFRDQCRSVCNSVLTGSNFILSVAQSVASVPPSYYHTKPTLLLNRWIQNETRLQVMNTLAYKGHTYFHNGKHPTTLGTIRNSDKVQQYSFLGLEKY